MDAACCSSSGGRGEGGEGTRVKVVPGWEGQGGEQIEREGRIPGEDKLGSVSVH